MSKSATAQTASPPITAAMITPTFGVEDPEVDFVSDPFTCLLVGTALKEAIVVTSVKVWTAPKLSVLEEIMVDTTIPANSEDELGTGSKESGSVTAATENVSVPVEEKTLFPRGAEEISCISSVDEGVATGVKGLLSLKEEGRGSVPDGMGEKGRDDDGGTTGGASTDVTFTVVEVIVVEVTVVACAGGPGAALAGASSP